MTTQTKIDTATDFQPQFDDKGLIPCVVSENESKDILMVAYMNEEALKKTLETGEMYYWSRSRNELWHKGATSGMVQKLIEMRIDCDQDCLNAIVEIQGPAEQKAACHTGKKSCFYRSISMDKDKNLTLSFNEE